jgi:hypothetical protein
MRSTDVENQVPQVSADQLKFDRTLKHLRKLRWIGRGQNDGSNEQNALSSLTAPASGHRAHCEAFSPENTGKKRSLRGDMGQTNTLQSQY